MRAWIALSIILLDSVSVAEMIERQQYPTASLLIALGGLWSVAGSWAGRHFDRERWNRLHLPLSMIAKQRRPKDSAVVRTLIGGGTLLLLLGITALFF